MNPIEAFHERNRELIALGAADEQFSNLTKQWFAVANRYEYSYHFEWLSRPIIQYPQDIVALQEVIWRVRPDLIVETGIAHGGSLILSASMLALLDYSDAAAACRTIDPANPRRKVLGIDVDIRAHNRMAIESHPLSKSIHMLQGSSTAPNIVAKVRDFARQHERVLVCLDSNHTHEHVFAELAAYAPLVSKDSYCVVFDTVIEKLADDPSNNRPWSRGNNPMTAVESYLAHLRSERVLAADGAQLQYEIDSVLDCKLMISVAPRGYLRRVSVAT